MNIEEPMEQEKPPCEFCTHEAKHPTEAPCIDCERIGFAQWSQYQPIFAGSPSWGDVLYYLREQNQYGLGTIVREGISHIKQLKLELEEARNLLERQHAALNVFYGSGWNYSDDEVRQIEKAKSDLSAWQLCTRQKKDKT